MQHSDFPLSPERVEQYVTKRLLVKIIWAFSGVVNWTSERRWMTSFVNTLVSIFLLLPNVVLYWTTTSRLTMANGRPGNPRLSRDQNRGSRGYCFRCLGSQTRLPTDVHAHYIYSCSELTLWARGIGIYEAIRPLEILSVEGLVRVWAHEALRLFQDRLVTEEGKQWTDEHIDEAAILHFPTINRDEALALPILFSNWTSKNYIPIDKPVSKFLRRTQCSSRPVQRCPAPRFAYRSCISINSRPLAPH